MGFTVLHTGQSGVERGADRAARLLGLSIEGSCSAERRDEMGVLPPDILRDLTPCLVSGARNALRATLRRADAVVIAVPERQRANQATGIDQFRRTARAAGVPHWVVDPTSDLDAVGIQINNLIASTSARLMITGPRRTRWHEGEQLGGRIVVELSSVVIPVPRRHRVLVVDTIPAEAELACDFVHALGHVCLTASDGLGALRIAHEFTPDIALVDLHLVDVSAYEVARILRARQTSPLFLAAIAGSAEPLERAQALAAGFDRQIVKPTSNVSIQQVLDEATLTLTTR